MNAKQREDTKGIVDLFNRLLDDDIAAGVDRNFEDLTKAFGTELEAMADQGNSVAEYLLPRPHIAEQLVWHMLKNIAGPELH